LLYLGDRLFRLDLSIPDERRTLRTIVFNTFVFMQIFNELNARRVDDGINIFKRIHKHTIFIIIFFITVVVQAIVTQFGGAAFRTFGLNWYEWLACIGIAFLSLPIGMNLSFLFHFNLF